MDFVLFLSNPMKPEAALNPTSAELHRPAVFSKRRFVSKCAWCLLLLMGLVSLTSCSYVERFIFRIDEGNTFPCVGVSRFEFVIQALEEGQDEIVQQKVSTSFADSDLNWNPISGKCQLKFGIPLKKIPYGGTRKVTIRGYDSTGKTVISTGTTKAFKVEPSGDDVEDEVVLPFQRLPNIKRGTLLIQFASGLPVGTSKVQVVLSGETRVVTVQKPDSPPDFILITNVNPVASGKLKLIAWQDNQLTQKLGESQETDYSMVAWTTSQAPANLQYFRRITISF